LDSGNLKGWTLNASVARQSRGAELRSERRETEMNSLTNKTTRLGFIGIGNMGSGIAKRLLEHG
jgi:phosphoglycerate dehydrogenase-like enzyme